jgi:molybdopterin converting factor small subunit
MQIEVLMFAAARDAADSERINVEVADGASAADLMDAIGQRLPELADLLPSCRLAIDNSYVACDSLVCGEHEIALIPPVSGG